LVIEGNVIPEDLFDFESIVAGALALAIVLLIFVLPSIGGDLIPRWHLRIFGLLSGVAMSTVLYPSLTGLRGCRLVAMGLLFVWALAISVRAQQRETFHNAQEYQTGAIPCFSCGFFATVRYIGCSSGQNLCQRTN
jgi:hypothetical protein